MPIYAVLVDAMRALTHVVRYATWRQREPGLIPELAQVRTDVALALVRNVLAQSPTGYELDAAQLTALLECYGVRLWPTRRVASREEAVAAAEEFGYPVVLKMTAEPARRVDLGGVRMGIGSAEDLAATFTTLAGRLSGSSRAKFVVQPMAPPGPAVVVKVLEDSSFGNVISFGLDGVATELLDDTAFRILPLTDVDAAELVRSVKAAPLLFGHRGAEPADVAALEDLLLRVSRLAEDLPQVAELELRPVVVGSSAVFVLHARAHIAPPPVVADLGPRRLG